MSVDALPRTPEGPGDTSPADAVATLLTSANGVHEGFEGMSGDRLAAAADLVARPSDQALIPELDVRPDPHRVLRRVLRWGCIALASLIIAVVAAFGYLYWQVSRIPRLATDGALDRRGGLVVEASGAPGGLQIDTPDTTPSGLSVDGTVPGDTIAAAGGGLSTIAGSTDAVAADGGVATPATPANASVAVPTKPGATPTTPVPTTIAARPEIQVPDTTPQAFDPNTDTGFVVGIETGPPPTVAGGALVIPAIVDPLGSDDAFNLLIAGTDSRDGLTGQSAKDAGQGKVSGNRPDSLMILRIDPKSHQAWTLSIPRDLWVRIDGTGKWDRINAAFSGSKPTARLIRTIRGNLGIPIHHVLAANFAGFQKLIGTVGGVNLCFPLPSRDTWTGLNQGQGCHLLDERQALAYARSRHFEEFRKGKWTPDGKGDLGRIVRQQAFLRASLRRAIDAAAGNPLTLNAMLANANDAVAIDDKFSITEIARLARDLGSYDPSTLKGYTVQVSGVRIDNKEVLRIKAKESAPILGQFRQVTIAG